MKENRANFARTQREASRRVAAKSRQTARPDSRKVNAQEEAPGRPRIMPFLWLKGMQGLLSQAFGFRVSRSARGSQRVDYFQGLHSQKQVTALRKRRAKNKVGRRQRVHQQMAKRGKK